MPRVLQAYHASNSSEVPTGPRGVQMNRLRKPSSALLRCRFECDCPDWAAVHEFCGTANFLRQLPYFVRSIKVHRCFFPNEVHLTNGHLWCVELRKSCNNRARGQLNEFLQKWLTHFRRQVIEYTDRDRRVIWGWGRVLHNVADAEIRIVPPGFLSADVGTLNHGFGKVNARHLCAPLPQINGIRT